MHKILIGFGLGYFTALVFTEVKEYKEDLKLKNFIPRIVYSNKEEIDNIISITRKDSK